MSSFQAFDGDAESPNNEVQYEILSGNRDDIFQIDQQTGMYSTQFQTTDYMPISYKNLTQFQVSLCHFHANISLPIKVPRPYVT